MNGKGTSTASLWLKLVVDGILGVIPEFERRLSTTFLLLVQHELRDFSFYLCDRNTRKLQDSPAFRNAGMGPTNEPESGTLALKSRIGLRTVFLRRFILHGQWNVRRLKAFQHHRRHLVRAA